MEGFVHMNSMDLDHLEQYKLEHQESQWYNKHILQDIEYKIALQEFCQLVSFCAVMVNVIKMQTKMHIDVIMYAAICFILRCSMTLTLLLKLRYFI